MLIRLLLLLLGTVASVQAQPSIATTNTPEAYWQWTTGSSDAIAPTPQSGEAIIRQAGAGNQATLVVLAGAQNRVELNQSATANAAAVRVTGQVNSLLVNQSGGGNVLNLDLTGNDNRMKISQNGGDVATLPGLTASGSRLELIQGNGRNTFVADGPTGIGAGAANLRIEQTGGATVRVQTGQFIGQ